MDYRILDVVVDAGRCVSIRFLPTSTLRLFHARIHADSAFHHARQSEIVATGEGIQFGTAEPDVSVVKTFLLPFIHIRAAGALQEGEGSRAWSNMYVPRGEDWSLMMLGALSSCSNFALSAQKIRTLKGVSGDREGRQQDTREYKHIWKSIPEQSSIVAVVVGASWDVGTQKAREWDVVWRSTDETETLLVSWNER